ncbi:MAG TPA: ABC transporter substrate-binding protein/permease [Fimbriiglobus sp.]|nr:ABC transporter substrate-binding protein/permease [Fimbriiglobus sp.]
MTRTPHARAAAALAVLLLFPALADAQELRWGTDPTGGAPFVYKPPGATEADPYIGFEVELADYLAKKLGRTSVLVDGLWKSLPELLDKPRTGEKGIDIVLNGYEERDDLKAKYAATVPYYVYRLALIARDDADFRDWGDLKAKAGQVGVLGESAAAVYAKRLFGEGRVLESDDVENVVGMVKDGRLAATVQDGPAAAHFVKKYPELRTVGTGRQPGYYVIYLRKGDDRLRAQLDQAIQDGFADGTLQRIYRKYGVWNEDQEWLAHRYTGTWPVPIDQEELAAEAGGGSIRKLIPQLLKAAGMTVLLAVTSFPLAMLAGMLVALVRVYGPRWLGVPLGVYVEVIRGTPLLLQLYVIFYMLPKALPALALDPLYAGIIGLAINYSAYEAENYRAGLRAIPRGQMEAALSLGMTRLTALRRIIVPQAFRIVIPPVTNDFIALFKDTSVCSVILITELTRKYNELYNFNRDLVVELAVLTAGLYLVMSYPLALLAGWLERRTGTHGGTR